MSDYFKSPLINASTLKCFAGDELEFSQIQAIHRYKTFKPSKAMNLGSAIHHGIEHIGREVSVEEYAEFFTCLKTPKSKLDNASIVPDIINSFKSQAPTMAQLVAENPKNCELEFYGEKYKAKADFVHDGIVYDWKSCNDTSYWGIRRSIKNLHYLIQAWLYREAIGAQGFTFVFIGTSAPHEVVYVPVTEDMFSIGEHEAMIAEQRFMDYKSGVIEPAKTYDYSFDAPIIAEISDFDL